MRCGDPALLSFALNIELDFRLGATGLCSSELFRPQFLEREVRPVPGLTARFQDLIFPPVLVIGHAVTKTTSSTNSDSEVSSRRAVMACPCTVAGRRRTVQTNQLFCHLHDSRQNLSNVRVSHSSRCR